MKYTIKKSKYNSINKLFVDSLLLKKGISKLHNKIIVKSIDSALIVTINPIEEA